LDREPDYRRRIREEREHAARLDALEVKRLRWHLREQLAPSLREIGEALRRPGEPNLADPWSRRLRELEDAGEVRRLIDVFGVPRFVHVQRVLTVDEMVPLGLARPEPPFPPPAPPPRAPELPSRLPPPRRRLPDGLFIKLIDRLERIERTLGRPVATDDLARAIRLEEHRAFAGLVEAEALGLVRSARILHRLVWSLL
jgi:hypothetical protein